jgi:hypothetical protein
MQEKILFLVPDGVGVRNYLYSNILKVISDQNIEATIGTVLPKEFIHDLEKTHGFSIQTFPIRIFAENLTTRLFREAATFGRLKNNAKISENKTILTNWNYNPKSLKQKVLNKTAEIMGIWASKNYNRILSLESRSEKYWNQQSVEKAEKLLKEIQPNKIFITHQRVAGLMPYCIAAKKLGIEVISVIYSWDNLPKGRLAVKVDKYLVWSDYMKKEMEIYYPEIPSDKVIITGTPQFEFYLQERFLKNRVEFAKENGLDASKKWICFSGDDEKTSPYDPQYLQDVAQAVSEMDERNRPQIIFRRCPVDFSGRYDEVLKKFETIIIAVNPLWNTPKSGQNWGYVFPQFEDIGLQVNLGCHCEFVINLGSTMAHDFAIFNKPCFYLNYDTVKDDNWSVKTIYGYQHFKSMEKLNAVGWLNSSSEIRNELEGVLSNTKNIGPDREKWLQKIVQHPIDNASVAIGNLLKN